MSSPLLPGCALFAASVIGLAACGAPQPPNFGATLNGRFDAPRSATVRFGLSPATSGGALLYFSGYTKKTGHTVFVLSYPSGKPYATLVGAGPLGLCTDSDGDVFTTGYGGSDIVEFRGTKQVLTLNDDDNYPEGCAVDPNSGDLAAVGGDEISQANLTVFQHLSTGGFGTRTTYKASTGELVWCAYDDKGDVFANGKGRVTGQQSALFELPRGGSQLKQITIDPKILNAGAVQWDGKYLAIGDPIVKRGGGRGPTVIYRLKVSGTRAKVVGTVKLVDREGQNDEYGGQFWISGGTIVTPVSARRYIGAWHYPAGGEAIKIYKAERPWGVTISP